MLGCLPAHCAPLQMVIDVLTDRGYHVSHSTEVSHVPMQIDLQTGETGAGCFWACLAAHPQGSGIWQRRLKCLAASIQSGSRLWRRAVVWPACMARTRIYMCNAKGNTLVASCVQLLLVLMHPSLPASRLMLVLLSAGMIKNRKEYKHRFHINWDTKGVREMAKAMELAARISEVGGQSQSARISQTYIPKHINRELGRGGGGGQRQLGDGGRAGGNGGPEEGPESEHVIHGS